MKWFLTALCCMTLSLSAMADDQKLCPVMPELEVDIEESVKYKDIEIFMCCASCVRAWELNPDYYAVAAMSVESEKPLLPQLDGVELPEIELLKQRYCPINRTPAIVCPESPTVEYKGKTIYFFKASNIRRWNRDPEGSFKKAREAGLLPQFDED
ncbi:MAG: hypothetical protein AAGI37_02165 [Planctomycetota bacterium]